eukprot:CAMPEP_0198197714 /NCGR_PEP_ID=MMETSP1445-20131203/1264_1 /TAXON_ID=36898 /ORGANISM="Pyramimonas sp., Strain CCMP2087" /LENGTH=140 /DNA_ID=CAMNT_0043867059 /DNA_START=517 /DNA_END=939 /DNA_ORIENTATION=-
MTRTKSIVRMGTVLNILATANTYSDDTNDSEEEGTESEPNSEDERFIDDEGLGHTYEAIPGSGLTDSGKSSTDSDNSEDSAPTDDTDSDEENHEELRNIRGKGPAKPHSGPRGKGPPKGYKNKNKRPSAKKNKKKGNIHT